MITAQLIAKAKPGDTLVEEQSPGLRLVVGSSKKSWRYRYRVGASLKQTVLGHYPAMDIPSARLAWGKAAQDKRERGADPARERKIAKQAAIEAAKPGVRVRDIISAYLDEHVDKNRSAKSAKVARGVFEKHLIPAIGNQLVSEIDAPAVVRLLRKIMAKTPAIAIHLRRDAGAAWRHATLAGTIPAMNPWRDVELPELKPNKGTRFFNDAELRTFLSWLPESELVDDIRDALELTLRTACRSGEIVALRWSDVDLDAGSFTLKDTKTDAPRTVRYPAAVAKILSRRRKDASVGARYVFPMWTDHRRPLPQQRLVAAIIALGESCPVQNWSAHDLRRSARTGFARLRVRHEVAEAALGHTKGGVNGIYNLHEYEAEVGEALATWNAHLDALGKPGAVVSIGKNKSAAMAQ